MSLKKHVSFSQLFSTFGTCELRHYYGYYLGIGSTSHESNRYLIMGSAVHKAMEVLGQGKSEDEAIQASLDEADARADEIWGKDRSRIGYDKEQMELDKFAATVMVMKIYENPNLYEGVQETERAGTIEIAPGITFKYVIDQVIENTSDRIVLGELKTRGNSYSDTELKRWAAADMQGKIYGYIMHTLTEAPKVNVRYIVVRRPRYLQRDKEMSVDKQKERILYGIKTQKKKMITTHMTGAMTPEIFSKVKTTVVETFEKMKRFYDDPVKGASEVNTEEKLANGVCRSCDFYSICHMRAEKEVYYKAR